MKTWNVLAVLMLLCAAVLAACTVAPMPAPADDAMAAEDEGPSGPVTLKFLALADDNQLNAWREILAEFQQINDGQYSYVELEFETIPFRELFPKIESSVAVGLPWDLFQADGPDMKHYGFNRVIWPLTDHFSEEEMAQWFPQSIEEGSFRDQFLGPPIMQSCSLLMYNKDFTDAAGVTPPVGIENAWTMEEAVAAWQDTTVDENGDGVPEVWGLRWGQGTWTGDYEHGIFRRSNGEIGSATYAGMGEDGVTFQGYLDTDEAAEAMQFYQDLHQTYKVSPVEAIPEIFESRQAAFMVTPDNRIGALNRIHGEGTSTGASRAFRTSRPRSATPAAGTTGFRPTPSTLKRPSSSSAMRPATPAPASGTSMYASCPPTSACSTNWTSTAKTATSGFGWMR